MQYKIIVDKQTRTNPSNEKKEYIIDIEELRCKGEIYDSLIITKDEDYVIRRLSLSEYQVLKVLDEPIKELIPGLNIELFEGDNYIYLLDMSGNRLCAEYLIKNDFNDTFITRSEATSAINQTAQQIELTVNQKLTGYSTTEEMNSAINMKADSITSEVNQKFESYDTSEQVSSKIEQKADSITSEVSKTYATKTQLATTKSEIKQTTDSITSTVSKKVGNDEVISKINQSAETVGINANKIQLSANDILNLLAGNTINLTSKNIVISSDKFSVDKNGNMVCNDAKVKGTIETSDGNIGGWKINSDGLSNGTVFIKNDGASTIYTVADLIIIRGYLMNYTGFELSSAMIKHYDINGDGKVNSADYVILQNLIGISMN